MKRDKYYWIWIIIITIMFYNFIYNYCLSNVWIGHNATASEEYMYDEYYKKIMGFSGYIKNNTIFPIRVKEINPIGTSGMKYVGTLITEWGFSEVQTDQWSKYDKIEGKIILPFKGYDLGHFYEFTEMYIVNSNGYEIEYSIFGLEFRNVVLQEYIKH